MDEPTVAETLPQRYREVLERIARLEAVGYRREAQLLRRDAVRAYSASWDARAMSSMDGFAARADRVLAGADRPRHQRGEHVAVRAIRLRLLRVSA